MLKMYWKPKRYFWWGRGDLNPGPRTPQARILDHARPRPLLTGLRSSFEGKIISTLLYLKKLGLAESTLRATSYRLSYMSRSVNLDDPEEVKGFIANKRCGASYKHDLVKAYQYYVKVNGLTWEKPRYKWERKLPVIPTTETVDKLVANASRKYAVIFRLLAETGIMPAELHNVTLRDIDSEKGLLYVQGLKGHASRVFKLKPRTSAMLRLYLTRNMREHPFPKAPQIGRKFRKYRDRLAEKLSDPAIKRVRLYDLRHYFSNKIIQKMIDP